MNSIVWKIVSPLILTLILLFSLLQKAYASAEPTVLKWVMVNTPGLMPDRHDIVSPCEINRLAIGSDGRTFYAVDIPHADRTTGAKSLYRSTDAGRTWSDTPGTRLYTAMNATIQINFRIWNLAIAPDNPSFIAVVTSNATKDAPANVWLSKDGGLQWENTHFPANEVISTIDVSPNYGGYDIAVGTRPANGGGSIWVLQTSATDTWQNQAPSGSLGDIIALRFSPQYSIDSAIIAVYSTMEGTFLNVGVRDKAANTTDWSVVYGGSPPEITVGAKGSSPKFHQIISADIDVPSDFCGHAAVLRRYYVSIDDNGATGTAGVYRFDDKVGYLLMKATDSRRISSIAYHGGFASGKLLIGELLGNPSLATVMTWFTDSPTTCPIPCWYPAMKPPTGAAGNGSNAYANTQVVWSPDGTLAYAATASSLPLIPGPNWYTSFMSGNQLDESAFSVSRNNGETWNQLSLIDTKIDEFVDIAPSPDCSFVYLASVNRQPLYSGFDSVWRSQDPTGMCTWERVLCQTITEANTRDCILQLPGDHADGQVVFWAARDTKKLMWSADFGDFWINVNPTLVIQDIAAEDSNTVFVLDSAGYVQRMVWEGKGWISQSTVPTGLGCGYSISTAYTGVTPDNLKGRVFVGGNGTGDFDVAYSHDGGLSFTLIPTPLPTRGTTLVIATQGYETERGASGDIIAINPGGMYQWSTSYGGGSWAWPSPAPNQWATLWGGIDWPTPMTSLSISRNGGFYFTDMWGAYIRWNFAAAGMDISVNFGSQPSRKLKICGGLELEQPVTVWLIDECPYNPPKGCVWCYVDTLLWSGPVPLEPVSLGTISCDPVSGRNTEVNLRWRPVSLSLGYRIEIAKDEDFALKVADIGNTWGGQTSNLSRVHLADPRTPYVPPDTDHPALVIPPGGGLVTDRNGNTWAVPALEAGVKYYWRVTVQKVATGDYITSPSSWRETFVVTPGLPVQAPYLVPELTSPRNGAMDCNTTNLMFTWTQLPEVTKYEFVLAHDPQLRDVITQTTVDSTSYIYDKQLEPDRVYFWRVRAVEPILSDWSFVSVFRTKSPPLTGASTARQKIPAGPLIAIAIGVLLHISLLVLVVRSKYE